MADMWIEGDRYQQKGVPDRVKMNQLNNLLHDALISTENVERCGIFNRKDCEQKAASPGLSLNKEQIEAISDSFKKCSMIRKEGLFFDDKVYKCIRADKNSIYAKSTQDNEGGLVVVWTASLLIIATYSSKMFSSVCIEAVEKLADYFKEKGR